MPQMRNRAGGQIDELRKFHGFEGRPGLFLGEEFRFFMSGVTLWLRSAAQQRTQFEQESGHAGFPRHLRPEEALR